MSLPSQVNTDKTKHPTQAMKEEVQHSGEVYYGRGPPVLKTGHSDSASSSGVYNPEKGHQSLPHYQQAAPVKWMQDSMQMSNWSQEAPMPGWGQNFGPYMSNVNVRDQMGFHKGVHEGVAMPMGGENQLPAPVETYRDAAQAQTQGRGLEWEQHAAAAMHQAQLQAYQHGQVQPHVPSHTLQGPVLQPFQASFRPSKQQFSSGYYSVFPGNKPMIYGEQPKPQQQLIPQMQQQQMHQQQQQQHQQQQHMHQQHHLQLQQQQQQQQHLQQQQIQQQQMQQLQQMQQQYQQMQEQQQQQQQIQQMQQQQQQIQQNIPQQETTQPQVQPKPQQTQSFGVYQPPEPRPLDSGALKEEVQSVEPQLQPEAQASNASALPDQCSEKVATNPADSANSVAPAAPRRSRRLSRDGQSPLTPPPTNIWSQASKEPPPPSQNGVAGAPAARGGESQVATGGVIQVTRRRRRASKEINLETLAQKASEMESLPAKTVKTEDVPSSRQASIVPLVIPVSVPVHKGQPESQGRWPGGRLGPGEQAAGQTDRKPVIVSRRRSIKNTLSFSQDEGNDPGLDEDGKSKFKRRTRPEPLIIPPHKPSTFIPPSLYSTITSYQSNLRSPVRLPDNPHALPPYTPPPILSPVRGGSGLYFSTFLTNIAVSNQILPPPATPKSATRSLLHSTSSEITPPVLPLVTDATPVCLEPRINIGQQYQAEIPGLQDLLSSQFDQHKADLVWHPADGSSTKHRNQDNMEDLMNVACSSVFSGGGTNQELVLHCLHESGGNILETLERLMFQDSIFPKGHPLAGYHYSGSDRWTAEEKCYFNKGIGAYRKDFFLVQKLVRTKTVAQCVEFYYTYKKQVKVSRSGILTFGPPDSPVDKHTDTIVDIKSSQQPRLTQIVVGEVDNKEGSYDESHESSQQARVAQSLQAHDYAGTVLVIKEPDAVKREVHHSVGPHRPRAEAAAKKGKAPVKPPQDPDAVFPCKKCNRVFYKVKSRSAHMKSHAEQEKKAAALRQKEEEEQAAAQARARKAAAAAAALAAAHRGGNDNAGTQQAEVSSQEDSSEGEDDDDEDWH